MYLTKYSIHDLKIYTYLGIFIVSRKWNEMSGPDLRRRVQVARYLQPFSKRKKNEKKTGDNIYLSIGDVSGPRQPKCHRSKRRERERERDFFSFTIERRKQLAASRARGIGLISEKEARIEIVSAAVFEDRVAER